MTSGLEEKDDSKKEYFTVGALLGFQAVRWSRVGLFAFRGLVCLLLLGGVGFVCLGFI